MATIKDVAKLAGVSPSTVSRVIADSRSISHQTKERVKKAMKELGYYPNMIARSLIKRSSQTLGLVLSRSTENAFTNPFFPEIIRGISTVAKRDHYSLLLSTAENHMEEAKQCLQMIMEKRVDGVILLASRARDELIERLSAENYPFVVVGRVPAARNIYSVNNDNIQAAYSAVRHLLNLGHRRIAFLNGPMEYIFCRDRYEGYLMAFREFGLEVNPAYVLEASLQEEESYLLTQGLLEMEEAPTAIFAADDLMAIGAYRAIKEKGLVIPDDIAVIGFNNDYFASLVEPALTTVRIPIYDLGVAAAETIIQVLKGVEVTPPQKILASELVVRDSCGAKKKIK